MKAFTTFARIRETLLSKFLAGSDCPNAIELAENTAPSFGAVVIGHVGAYSIVV